MRNLVCVVSLALLSCGCSNSSKDPGACRTQDDCDDGVFCNGIEDCADSTCVDGTSPCENEKCLEETWECVDWDECAGEYGGNNCDPLTTCTNTNGSFVCSGCPAGYLDVYDDGTSCQDWDECAGENGGNNCDPLTTCSNTDGAFACGDCPAGYNDVNGDGTLCEDWDECAGENGGHNCDPLTTCTNTSGAFTCSACPAGYNDVNGDGTLCEDWDECAGENGGHNCDGACVNELGGFRCGCPDGFEDVLGDGTQCEDWDECAGENGGHDCDPLTTCTNTSGAFTCSACPTGYNDVNGDGTLCEDWDECAGENGGHNCGVDICVNTDGSFYCECGNDQVYIDGWSCAQLERARWFRMAAGYMHSCVVASTGGAFCWGNHEYGRLGSSQSSDQTSAEPVQDLDSGVVSIVAGKEHACALTDQGAVMCWGRDNKGQLGDEFSFTNFNWPQQVQGLSSGVLSITAGGEHTCEVSDDGSAKCWGEDEWGQLGTGDASFAEQPTPVDVIDLGSQVVTITAGLQHTCALTVDGGVKCWGLNSYGQIGNSDVGWGSSVPVDVDGLTSGVVQIDAGENHTCAVTDSGGVKCWGRDEFGQLGDGGTNTDQPTPVDVQGLASDIVLVTAGDDHTCAFTDAAAAKCWGKNDVGQLGNNDPNGTEQTTAVNVFGLSSGVISLAAGGVHTCAYLSDESALCWGADNRGQLGDDDPLEHQNAPVEVVGLP